VLNKAGEAGDHLHQFGNAAAGIRGNAEKCGERTNQLHFYQAQLCENSHPVPPGATLYHPLTSQGTPAPPAAMTRKSPQWLAHLNQKENIQKKTCNEIKPGTEEKLQPDYKSQFKAFEYLSIFSLGLSVSLKRRRKGKARLEAGAILS